MKVLQEFRNELLKRNEIVVDMNSGSNPGFAGAMKAVAQEFEAKEENVVVKKIDSKYGSDNFILRVFIYDSPEARAKIELKAKPKKEKKQ